MSDIHPNFKRLAWEIFDFFFIIMVGGLLGEKEGNSVQSKKRKDTRFGIKHATVKKNVVCVGGKKG